MLHLPPCQLLQSESRLRKLCVKNPKYGYHLPQKWLATGPDKRLRQTLPKQKQKVVPNEGLGMTWPGPSMEVMSSPSGGTLSGERLKVTLYQQLEINRTKHKLLNRGISRAAEAQNMNRVVIYLRMIRKTSRKSFFSLSLE